MEKEMHKATAMMYRLIVAVAISALIWAWFMPVENSVAAIGQIHYLGKPQAVCMEQGGVVKGVDAKSFEHVGQGVPLIRIISDKSAPVTVSAPREGALIWQRGLMEGDRVQVGERLAVVYPDEPLGLLIRLPDRDVRKIKTGMTVRVRMDSYPFQEYGVLYGTVSDISPELGENGLIETNVLVSLDDLPQGISLRPGLAAGAEIITGQTTLLKKILF